MKKVKITNSEKEFFVNKIVCVGKNYLEHAKELGDAVPEKPVIFLKPSSAIINSGENIIYPDFSNSLHYETELVLLIGKSGKNIKAEKALDHVEGYTIGLDMTLRDIQSVAKKNGHPWTIAKCFDTSAVISDILPKNEFDSPDNLKIELKVNGLIKQADNTSNMIFSVAQIIEYISTFFTLEEGDLIYTGTPKGVGEVKRGDILEANLDNKIFLKTEVI